MTREEFIHRHNRFNPPTFFNVFFTGMIAGVALAVIVICVCNWLTN